MTMPHVTACREGREQIEEERQAAEEEAANLQDASERISTTKQIDIALT